MAVFDFIHKITRRGTAEAIDRGSTGFNNLLCPSHLGGEGAFDQLSVADPAKAPAS